MKNASIFGQIMAIFNPKTKTPKNTSRQAPQRPEPYMYITVKGKKFHYDPCCSGLRNAKTIKMELSKAKKAGYTACDKCCYSYLHE